MKIKNINIYSKENGDLSANVNLSINNRQMKLVDTVSGFSMTCSRGEALEVMRYCLGNIYLKWNYYNSRTVKFINIDRMVKTDGLQAIVSALLIMNFLWDNSPNDLSGSKLTDLLPPRNTLYFPSYSFTDTISKNTLDELIKRSVLYTCTINSDTKKKIYFRPFNVLTTKGRKSVPYQKAYKHIISNGEKSWEPEKECCDKCGSYTGDSFWIKLKNLFND